MIGTCESVKESCDPFIEPQLTSFLVFYNLPRVFKIFTAYHSIRRYQENSGSIATSLDANTKNTIKYTSQINWFYNFILKFLLRVTFFLAMM